MELISFHHSVLMFIFPDGLYTTVNKKYKCMLCLYSVTMAGKII